MGASAQVGGSVRREGRGEYKDNNRHLNVLNRSDV